MAKKFNPQKLTLTPSESALVKAAEGINSSLRSRAHLLAIIDGLDLKKTSIEVKMVYVLAMLSLGFTRSRALGRLKITPNQYAFWRRNEENQTRVRECQSRGELILEETVLLAAESDPKLALTLLEGKDRKADKEEEVARESEQKVEDIFTQGLKDRGVVEAKLVGDEPSELK